MKTKKITQLLTLAFCAIAFAFVTSCEGPAGKDGAPGVAGTNGSDGTNGVDGNVTCLSCHNTDTKNLIAAQFNSSQHKAGDVAVDYAGGRGSCAECHSHEGYLEFALTGDVAADIANPQAWECSTCHAIHTDFAADDYAFRLGDPVVLLANGSPTIDGGTNNTCINCHQSRRDVVSYDDPNAVDATYTRTFTGADATLYYVLGAVGPSGSRTFWNAGSASGNVQDSAILLFDVPVLTNAYISSTHAGPHHGPQGNVWAGLGGVLPGVPFDDHAAGCVACHMGPATGHSFWPEEGNCAVCHSTDKMPGLSTTADRIQAAGEALELIGAVHFSEGAFHPMYASLDRDDFNAWWDFMVVLEDRSNGAHNPVYVDALLDGIEAQLGL